MPEMLDLYINVCLKVTGRDLEAETANPIINQYNRKLRDCRLEEKRDDGKFFKCWVVDIDDFKHELLAKDVLICSRRVRFEIRDPYPHEDNRMNYVQAKVHKLLMGLKVGDSGKIVAETMGTNISGNTRTGRWPRSPFDGAF